MAFANLALLLSALAPAVLASPVAHDANAHKIHHRQSTPNKVPPGLGPRPQPSVDSGATRGCTFTTKAVPTVPPCAWDGTLTVWPTTTYAVRSVNCRGCNDIAVLEDIYPCPNKPVEETVYMQEPTTCWNTVCATSTASPDLVIEAQNIPAPTEAPNAGVNADLRQRDEVAAPATTTCATTLVRQPPQTAGKTCTHYAQTTTKTVGVNCGGCSLVVSTALAGYGPPTRFTTTITAPLAVETAFQCQ